MVSVQKYFIVFFLMLGGLAVSFYGYQHITKITSLFETGERAQATATKIDYISPQKQGRTGQYIPIVQWQTEKGDMVEVRAKFGSPESITYHTGDVFTVVYDKASPREKYYVLQKGQTSPSLAFTDYIFSIVGGIFILGGLVTMFRRMRIVH